MEFYQDIPDTPSQFNRHGMMVELGETLTRSGDLKRARKTLTQALRGAEQAHLPAILRRLAWLSLREGDLPTARIYNNRRVSLNKSLDLPNQEDDGFLLVAEGRFDEAIAAVRKDTSTAGGEKLNKAAEIQALLVLARAWHGKGDGARAREHLERARALMERTGCWRERDRLEETEALLGAA